MYQPIMTTEITTTCLNIVADGEKYTAMARLLIRSIEYFHRNDPSIKIVVGIPEDNKEGESLHNEKWDVNISFVMIKRSPIIIGPNSSLYRHFNKITLLETSAKIFPKQNHMFLDSDLVFLRKLPLLFLQQFNMCATPVHYFGWHGDWKKLYKSLGCQIKDLTICTSGYQVTPAYYNAGVIWVKANIVENLKWGRRALEIARMHGNDKSMNIFPWLDQLSLPFAANDLGLRITELPESLNMYIEKFIALLDATSRQDSKYTTKTPFILHYHGNIARLEYVLKKVDAFKSSPRVDESLKILLNHMKSGLITGNSVL